MDTYYYYSTDNGGGQLSCIRLIQTDNQRGRCDSQARLKIVIQHADKIAGKHRGLRIPTSHP